MVIVKNNCGRIKQRFTPRIVQILNKGILDTKANADPFTPVDQGYLKGNVKFDMASPGNLRSRVRWLQEYGPAQNYGTRRGIVGKHFVEKGANATSPGVLAALSSLEGDL